MEDQRWRAAEQLFHDALALPVADRARFLTGACGRDADLKHEVESLLAMSAGNRLEALPSAAAAAWLDEREAESMRGRTIGPYRVAGLIGSGGMGEVFAAEDVRLGRRAALKLLRAPLGTDAERVRRFEIEARAASALNHPNIVTIYDIGTDDGRPFIVSELIEGETLRERLRRGPLAVIDAVDISRQIAAALDVAHRAGIVHRDVKPENIMLRTDGYVKLLDFGVAKLVQAAAPLVGTHVSSSHPRSSGTQDGALMGTPAYMSPEHAAGQDGDPRVDIYALGIVAYEMVAGRRPAEQARVGDRASVKGKTAARFELEPSLPAGFATIVERALERDPDRRHATASELLHDLEALERTLTTGDAPAANRVGLWLARRWGLAAAVLMGLAFAAALLVRLSTDAPIAASSFVRLTDESGNELHPSLSPDARWFVYAAQSNGVWDVYRKPLGGQDAAINLTGGSPLHGTMPAISPDGRRIVYSAARQSGGILLMDADGGHVTRLAESGGNPSWLPDGRRVIYASEGINEPTNRSSLSHLVLFDLETGGSRSLETGDAVQPHPSPHGVRVAYWGSTNGHRDIWTVALAGGQPVAVTDGVAIDWDPVWSPDGRFLYFLSNRAGSMNVWRVAIDEQSGAVRSAPQPITAPATYAKHLSASADGTRLAYVQSVNRAIVRRLAFDPDRGTVVSAPTTVVERSLRSTDPSVSHDGQWLAFSSEGETREEIFVARADGSGIRPLTNDAWINRLPDWSPDGSRVAFYSNRSGHYEIWSIRPDGRGLEQLSAPTRKDVNTPVWSPDGRRIAYHEAGRTWIRDLGPGGSAELVPEMPGATSGFTTWSWAPDGSGLLGWTNSPNLKGVHSYSFASHAYERLTTTGFAPTWLQNGHQFLFLSDSGALQIWDDQSRKARELFHADRVDRFSLPSDNKTIFYTSLTTEGDVWIMTLGATQKQ